MEEEKVQGITEETAQQLNETFEKLLHNTMLTNNDIVKNMGGIIINTLAMTAGEECEKAATYLGKMARATFLTRWYWKIRYEAAMKRFKAFHAACIEFKNKIEQIES